MSAQLIYSERVSSKKTELFFVALTLLFLLLFAWRVMKRSVDFLAVILLLFFSFFLFYSLNYRTLLIRLTTESLMLSFGIFTWKISLNNINDILTDEDLPILTKYGGAGIHFMLIRKGYLASFNFLEHSRVVIGLKRKAGLVTDIAFSTCHPNELIQLIQGAISANNTA
jgi:hypothetical protein